MSKTIEQRVRPQNVELEMAVLGGIMLEPEEAYPLVANTLSKDSFYLSGHGILFSMMGELHHRGTPPDILAVYDELKSRGLERQVLGGMGVGYLAAMTNSVPTAANVEAHAKIVAEKAHMRQLMRLCDLIIEEGYKQELPFQKQLDIAERSILELARSAGARCELVAAGDSVGTYWQMIQERRQAREGLRSAGQDDTNWVPGLQSPFPGLNRSIKGFMPSTLTTIAARSSTGKTALMLNFAHDMAVSQGLRVGFISLEQSIPAINNRLLTIGTRGTDSSGSIRFIDSRRIDQVGEPLSDQEWRIARQSRQRIASSRLLLAKPMRRWDGEGGVLASLKSMADEKCDVIFLDYLGAINRAGKLDDWESQAEHAANTKGFADRTGIPIITGVQVGRNSFVNNKRTSWIGQHNISRTDVIFNESDNVLTIEPLLLDDAELRLGRLVAKEPPVAAPSGKWPELGAALFREMVPGMLGIIKARDGCTGVLDIGWYPYGVTFVERSAPQPRPTRSFSVSRRDQGESE